MGLQLTNGIFSNELRMRDYNHPSGSCSII